MPKAASASPIISMASPTERANVHLDVGYGVSEQVGPLVDVVAVGLAAGSQYQKVEGHFYLQSSGYLVRGLRTSLRESPSRFQQSTSVQATMPGVSSIQGTTLRALMLPAS